jgi:hypothetical protein
MIASDLRHYRRLGGRRGDCGLIPWDFTSARPTSSSASRASSSSRGWGGLAYRGQLESNPNVDVTEIVAIDTVEEIPGESKMGIYDTATGEIRARE